MQMRKKQEAQIKMQENEKPKSASAYNPNILIANFSLNTQAKTRAIYNCKYKYK